MKKILVATDVGNDIDDIFARLSLAGHAALRHFLKQAQEYMRTRDIEANTMDTEGRDLSIVPFGDKFVLNEPSLNTFASFEKVNEVFGNFKKHV